MKIKFLFIVSSAFAFYGFNYSYSQDISDNSDSIDMKKNSSTLEKPTLLLKSEEEKIFSQEMDLIDLSDKNSDRNFQKYYDRNFEQSTKKKSDINLDKNSDKSSDNNEFTANNANILPKKIKGQNYLISLLANFGLFYSLKPSGERDISRFDISELSLGFDFSFSKKQNFNLILEGEEVDQDSNKNFNMKVNNFYYQLNDFWGENSYFRIGQIPFSWFDTYYERWDIFTFKMNKNFLEKFGYISNSDFGFGIQKSWNKMNFNFSLINGEGYQNKEEGVNKDLVLNLTINPWLKNDNIFFIDMFVVYGKYEKINDKKNNRDRWGLSIGSCNNKKYLLSLEYYNMKDPAEKVDANLADEAQTNSRFGEISSANGYSILFDYYFKKKHLNKFWGMYLKYDQLDPDDKISQNDVNHVIFGLLYQVNENLKTSLSRTLAKRQKNHGATFLEEETINFEMQMSF